MTGVTASPERLAREIENFQDIASYISPQSGEVPRLRGFDVSGQTVHLNGDVGGDHVIFVDFKQRYNLEARIAQAKGRHQLPIAENLRRCRKRAGIAVVDVAGHRITDALLAAMFHQAFLLGSIYELDLFGEITGHLFENLNTRFYNSSGVHKFLTMLYAEIGEDARFRFLSAAHPAPLVFSYLKDRFMEVEEALRSTSPPLGTMPSSSVIDLDQTPESLLGVKGRYEWNEWTLMGRGDVLLLGTDGLLEHRNGEIPYVPDRLEHTVRRHKDRSATEIVAAIVEDSLAFSAPADDMTVVAIKRT